MTDYTVLADQQALLEAVLRWQSKPFVALDTEFVRTKTFYPNLGLVQIYDGEQITIIDPFLVSDLSPLATLMADETVLKVLHACSEDIELIDRVLGVLPVQVWDTQIGAQFDGERNAVGLAKLVEQTLGIELAKDQTQSDWLARPLSDQQLTYAALDVKYLYDVYQRQRARLDDKGLSQWVLEDSALQVQNSLPPPPPDYYLRLRGGWALKGASLWLLAQLAAWREQQARQRNLPRGFVIKDPQLIAIAEQLPQTPKQLANIQGVPQAFVRKYGDNVCSLAKQAKTVNRDQLPARIPGPLPSATKAQMKAAKQCLQQLSEQLGVPSEVLGKRKPIEQLLRSGLYTGEYQLPNYFQGWRAERVANVLIECFEAIRLGQEDEA